MPPPTVTPIVVAVTAQVVNNVAVADIRGFQNRGIIEKRNVQVTGEVSVTGGTATVDIKVTYTATLDNGEQAFTAEMDALSLSTIAPGTPGTPFTVNIPINSAPGLNASGTVRVDVTGTDERGGMVNVSTELTVTEDNTRLPAGTCTEDDTTLCLLTDRFEATVDWVDPDGNQGPGVVFRRPVGSVFFAGWFTFGASAGIVSAGGFDLRVEVQDFCSSDGTFRVLLDASQTDVEFTLQVTDTQTNQTREYFNPQSTIPDRITDTSAFATCS